MRQHCAVSRHDDWLPRPATAHSTIRLSGSSAENCERFGRLDELTQFGEKDGNARERFAVMSKLSGEDG